MSDIEVAVIVGSLRKESNNLKLAKALIKLGADFWRGQILRIDDLPLFNQDLEKDFPAPARRFKDEIEKANAVLLVTPEYNRSISGVLKNAIDWASRPYGKNSFAGKPCAIAGASPGSTGTACAQHDLRAILGCLDLRLMGQPELYLQFKDGLIDADGNIADDGTRAFLQKFVGKFIAWIGKG
ncbi:MAG TPA: NADPH-dependent FMN reductase [Alphaproteobacteria bacterium]|nr:NADPH-dependent FMN reductase [Alphaproteobacteria bacterium]